MQISAIASPRRDFLKVANCNSFFGLKYSNLPLPSETWFAPNSSEEEPGREEASFHYGSKTGSEQRITKHLAEQKTIKSGNVPSGILLRQH